MTQGWTGGGGGGLALVLMLHLRQRLVGTQGVPGVGQRCIHSPWLHQSFDPGTIPKRQQQLRHLCLLLLLTLLCFDFFFFSNISSCVVVIVIAITSIIAVVENKGRAVFQGEGVRREKKVADETGTWSAFALGIEIDEGLMATALHRREEETCSIGVLGVFA